MLGRPFCLRLRVQSGPSDLQNTVLYPFFLVFSHMLHVPPNRDSLRDEPNIF
jgi:hypothetical protein